MTEELSEFPNHKLKTPMEVSIIEIEGHYYATNNEFEICADGNTADEAVELFKVFLGEMYERAKKLTGMVEDE
jgi:hypothetical protein